MHLIDQELQCMLKGEFEQGWKISQQLEEIGPDRIKDPSGKINKEMWLRHCFNRGWFLLQQGDFQTGSQLCESGRFLNTYGSGRLLTDKPLWKGEDPKDKTIIISLEGGYGDEIIHARFAKTLADRGATVILAASPEIVSVFERIEGVSKVITRSQEDILANPHDYWIPGFSVGWVAGHTYQDLPKKPYLRARSESIDLWRNLINSEKKKIGIRWSGNPKFEHQQFRLFDAKYLTKLCENPNLQIYSLQRDNDLRELDSRIVDLQHLLISWEDTLAAISNLDLVITSCTSIAHASAAMGKETWVITPILPYHVWATGAPTSTDTPWYTSVRIFRQHKFGEWDSTFKDVYTALAEKYDDINIEIENSANNLSTNEDLNIQKEEQLVKHRYFFISGLPNSGGNLIQQILSQNPNLNCSNNNGLCELLTHINYNWDNLKCISDSKIKLKVLKSILNSYNDSNAEYIVNKHSNWINLIPLLDALTESEVKIIVPVRNPAEILSVYEQNRKLNFLKVTDSDKNIGTKSTIAGRCMHYSSPNGPLGLSHAQILDAINSGFKDRLLFVEYNKLCNEPNTQLDRIYKFLELDRFDHNLGNMIKKDHVVPADIIGFDLYQQYNTQIFWQNWI